MTKSLPCFALTQVTAAADPSMSTCSPATGYETVKTGSSVQQSSGILPARWHSSCWAKGPLTHCCFPNRGHWHWASLLHDICRAGLLFCRAGLGEKRLGANALEPEGIWCVARELILVPRVLPPHRWDAVRCILTKYVYSSSQILSECACFYHSLEKDSASPVAFERRTQRRHQTESEIKNTK